MIGGINIPEMAVIVVVAAVLFFGRNVVIDWIETIAQVKKTYNKKLKKK